MIYDLMLLESVSRALSCLSAAQTSQGLFHLRKPPTPFCEGVCPLPRVRSPVDRRVRAGDSEPPFTQALVQIIQLLSSVTIPPTSVYSAFDLPGIIIEPPKNTVHQIRKKGSVPKRETRGEKSQRQGKGASAYMGLSTARELPTRQSPVTSAQCCVPEVKLCEERW